MKCILALLLCILYFVSGSTDFNKVEFSIATTSVVAQTDETWACANFDHWPEDKCDQGVCEWLDKSLHHIDLSNALLQNAVKAFDGKLRLRLGGTLADCVLYDVGVTKDSCVEFSAFNVSYRWGYKPFTGCLHMDRWDDLNSFCVDNDCSILFGLNAMYGREYIGQCPVGTDCESVTPHPACCTEWTGAWDSSMARDFYAYTASKGYKMYAFEFGNELAGDNGIEAQISPEQYAADYIKFVDLTREYFGREPKLVTTDGTFDADFLNVFLDLLPEDYKPDILTNHLYSLGAGTSSGCGPNALNPSKLNSIYNLVDEVNEVIANHAPNTAAWVGEAGGAYGSGRDYVTNSFNSPFWYLDQMAIFAGGGFGSYCRQTLVGGFYSLLNITTLEPTPDYYSLLMWSRTMGSKVLSSSISDPSEQVSSLRGYTHCSSDSYAEGSITILLMNFNDTLTMVPSISLPDMDIDMDMLSNMERHEYIFTSAGAADGATESEIMMSKFMRLNGEILQTSNNVIPVLEPKVIPANSGQSIELPPYSFGFFVIPGVNVGVCKSKVVETFDIQWAQTGSVQDWNAIAVSGSGRYQTAIVYNGLVYRSDNYGVTFNAVEIFGPKTYNFQDVDMDQTGQYQAIVEYNSMIIYLSSNFASSFVTSTISSTKKLWQSISLTYDGVRQLAAVSLEYIYLSSNRGVSFAAVAPAENWLTASLSGSTGKVCAAIAGTNPSLVFISTDYCLNWFQKFSSSIGFLRDMTLSGAGDRMAMVSQGGFIYLSSDSGFTWNQVTTEAQQYSAIAMTSDGKNLIASVSQGYIYLSNDYGVTFYPTESDKTRIWQDVAVASESSENPKYFSAVVGNGLIFTSGPIEYITLPWTSPVDLGEGLWQDISISYSGQYQTACIFNGFIYITYNFGSIWTKVATREQWESVSISADGSYQSAVVNNGNIWISSDYGFTWTVPSSASSLIYIWNGISMSSDGQYQTAVITNGNIYISSDFGQTWSSVNLSKQWAAVDLSSDGASQVAIPTNGLIYVSTNFGAYWNGVGFKSSWVDVAISSNGNLIAAVALNDYIWTSLDGGNSWAAQGGFMRQWTSIDMSDSGLFQIAGASNGYVYLSYDFGETWDETNSISSWYSVAISGLGGYLGAVSDIVSITTQTQESLPTTEPTRMPFIIPTRAPVSNPTTAPLSPTNQPINSPTITPISTPTNSPVTTPVNNPTNTPISSSTNTPITNNPTNTPNAVINPTNTPITNNPAYFPSVRPSLAPNSEDSSASSTSSTSSSKLSSSSVIIIIVIVVIAIVAFGAIAYNLRSSICSSSKTEIVDIKASNPLIYGEKSSIKRPLLGPENSI